MSETIRWAKKEMRFNTKKGNRKLTEEDLPTYLKLPLVVVNLAAETSEVEVTRRFVDGERIPVGLTSAELKWFREVAEKYGIEIEEQKEIVVSEPNTHTTYSPDPCIRLSHLENYGDLQSEVVINDHLTELPVSLGERDDWLDRWFEQTDIEPNRVQEDTDGELWVSIKDGLTISMVRDWDDLSAVQTEQEAMVEVSFVWTPRTLTVSIATQNNGLWIDDPILKIIIKRVTDAWRLTIADPNDFVVECEGLLGAQRTQECDPSYFQPVRRGDSE